jgi:hypothetical protein
VREGFAHKAAAINAKVALGVGLLVSGHGLNLFKEALDLMPARNLHKKIREDAGHRRRERRAQIRGFCRHL